MGYTTDFEGQFEITPPLSLEEGEYLMHFSESRRMKRHSGPYTVDEDGLNNREDVIGDGNDPPTGQPGLWCQWVPTQDGKFIEWDEGEKFYRSAEWIKYLIDHFLKPDCLAKDALPFLLANHVVNGRVEAQGEDPTDTWAIIVKDNVVYRQEYEKVPKEPELV
jgi:hypothetical protein